MKRKIAFVCVTLMMAFNTHAFSKKAEKHLTNMQRHAPADSVLYFDGIVDKKTRQALGKYYGSQYPVGTAATLREALAQEGVENPAFEFFLNVIERMEEEAAPGIDHFFKAMQLADDTASAIYLDGLMPVIRVSVKKPDALMAMLEDAAEQSEIQAEEKTVAGKKVKTWLLNEDQESKLSLSLAAYSAKGVFTLATYTSKDSDDALAQRLALAKRKDSIASKSVIKDVRNNYDLTLMSAGFIDLLGLLKGFYDPSSNLLGQQAKALGGDHWEEISSEVSPECQADYVAMMENYPKLVFGAKSFNADKDHFEMTSTMALEIANPKITEQLVKLNGHISNAATVSDQSLLGLALGLNLNNLTPAFTELWTMWTSAEFKCPSLLESQEQVRAANPANLVVITAMAQGLQGVSLSIQGLELGSNPPATASADALLAVTAEKPEVLAGLLGTLPQFSGIVIPTDGSFAEVPLPPTVPVKAKIGIQGKNIVLTTGPKSEALAKTLVTESINTEGTFALGLNYSEITALTDDVINTIAATNPVADAGTCAETYIAMTSLSAFDGVLNLESAYTPKGVEIDMVMDMSLTGTQEKATAITGDYEVESLGVGCLWEQQGVDTLSKDGTGQYKIPSDDGECFIYEAEYLWQQVGNRLEFTETKNTSRNDCASDWETPETEDLPVYDCSIFDHNGSGFSCVFTEEDSREVFRYAKAK